MRTSKYKRALCQRCTQWRKKSTMRRGICAACQKAEAGITVHLVLTFHWFDEMLAGRKCIEYRAMIPHWKRLIWDRRGSINHARFSRAYTSHTITRPVLGVDCGPCPYEGWDGLFYRLHLGFIVNYSKLTGEQSPTNTSTITKGTQDHE